MSLWKRIGLLWRVLKLLPRLETLEVTVPTLETLESAIPKLEAIDAFLPKIQALERIFERVNDLNSLIARLEAMNEPVLVHTNGKATPQPTPDQTIHDYHRLQLLVKFSHLQGKAKEIETEWRTIQQDAHDKAFYNQVFLGKGEVESAQKDGFARGIRWVLEKYG